jgi:hypothetical protein
MIKITLSGSTGAREAIFIGFINLNSLLLKGVLKK